MTKSQQWFATSRFGPEQAPTWKRSADEALTLIHAKKLGTVLSACGQSTTSWFKHWEPFRVVGGHRVCGSCVRAVAAELEAARSASARDPGPVARSA